MVLYHFCNVENATFNKLVGLFLCRLIFLLNTEVKLSILGQSQNQNTTSSVNLIMLPPITTLIQLGLFVYKKIVKLGVKSSNYPFISLLIYWLIMFSINQSIT